MKINLFIKTFIIGFIAIVSLPQEGLAGFVRKGCFGKITVYTNEEITVYSQFEDYAESMADNVRWSSTEELSIADAKYRNENWWYYIVSEDYYRHSCVLAGRKPTIYPDTKLPLENLPKLYCHLNYKGTRYIGYYEVEVLSLGELKVYSHREGNVVYFSCPDADAELYYAIDPSGYLRDYDGTDMPIKRSPYPSSGVTIPNDGKSHNICGFAIKPKYTTGLAQEYDCKYTIYPTSIELNHTSLSLETGQTAQLEATVYPTDASNKDVTWSSSDPSIAKVDLYSGLVTGVAKGKATITCTANDGSGVAATCEVTVQSSTIYVSSITLNATEKNLMIDDDPFQLVATILPSNATNKSVTWTSSDETVAKVDAEGLVTPVDVGDAIITCKANDGSGKYATCKIHIAMTYADIRFVSVVCDNKNLDRLTQDDKLAFHATFKNEGEADWIYSMIAICDKEMTQIIASGEEDLQVYPAGEEIKIDYEYGLDTIPAGNYYATVFYYNWNSGFWNYESPYLYEITVSDKPGPDKPGDVNGDGQVNGTDLVALTNIILGRSTKTSGADVNGDGQVNGTDYVALTNIILGKSKAPKRMVTAVPKTVPEALQKRLKGINLIQQPIKKLER